MLRHLNLVKKRFLCLAVLGYLWPALCAEPLRVSVYATADDVLRWVAPVDQRERLLQTLKPLRVSRLFLEGRRGDEYVSPQLLAEARDFLASRGIQCSGGIATVPGTSFGIRQDTPLTWLNWQSPKTQTDVAAFFTENAPLFDTLIIDDFYCTADTSPISAQARGSRAWPEYRRDLLASLLQPMVIGPARAARSDVRLVMKFPQWYDRFHLFGYDPARFCPLFDQVWVGTEVRNPKTRRMGFVQPTEGYMNFRWLSSLTPKTTGAWFDHIECTPENFIDQAFMSVLAGAKEITLFHLSDLIEANPADALLASRMTELCALASKLQGLDRRGIAFYKPPGSDAADNLYLADYLGMIGLPMLPVASYPANAKVVFLAAQAATDREIVPKIRQSLNSGTTLIMTPAFIRLAGPEAAALAGVRVDPSRNPTLADRLELGSAEVKLASSLQIDAGVHVLQTRSQITAGSLPTRVPVLTTKRQARGRVLVLNLRTFSESDFGAFGEWLLAPSPLGVSELPPALCGAIRQAIAAPVGLAFDGPSGLACTAFAGANCFYSFHDQPVGLKLKRQHLTVPAHGWVWVEN
jgi:hypothetical protein